VLENVADKNISTTLLVIQISDYINGRNDYVTMYTGSKKKYIILC
jgi:hypothetical protein